MDNGREDQNPWTKWFWADYASDTGLASSSLAAQGLWMRMLSYMARSKRKGYLLDGGKQMESKTLAKLTGELIDVVEMLLIELEKHEVFSRDNEGIIYNRRMVRESALSQIRSEAGRLGGRPKKQTESKMKAKAKQHVKAPSASASASASSFNELNNKKETKGDAKIKREKINFNHETSNWEGITEEKKALWKKAYPDCNIEIELTKATAWIIENPTKGNKSQWGRFIIGWLSRTQNAGGTKGTIKNPTDDPNFWKPRMA